MTVAKNSKIEFSFNPTRNQLDEIKNWLIEELDLEGHSFHCKWEFIESVYNKKVTENIKYELATISEDNQTIGFVIWSKLDYEPHSATIQITATKPSHRSRGLGKMLINKLIQKLIAKKIYILELECISRTSEAIWRHFGFVEFPENDYWKGAYKKLYKVIVPSLEIQDIITVDEYLELWNNGIDETKELNSTWKWNLIFRDGTRVLEKPIIHPCQRKWRIRWKTANSKLKDTKVNYFSNTKIIFGDFLIIREIPE